ncbi:MAG TPA: methylmalonyl Co-A mutase-associated GTPase MeaB [Microlunatus sp.]
MPPDGGSSHGGSIDPGTAALIEAARAGRPRALGRLISLVENDAPQLRTVLTALLPERGRARVVGVTGAPGVGKSTTVTGLIALLRAAGERVAVLAVDPSSPFSGGALLGDRVRMQSHATDSRVFIRSMATRGHLGGLAVAAPQALRVLDGGGFDTVIVETVGVGQSEVEVAGQADITLVLLAPGMGDGIQAAKAGILEVGDIFVVNKADRDGAQSVVRELRGMLALTPRAAGDKPPAIITTVAVDGEGLDDLLEAINRFAERAQASGSWQRRRWERARAEVAALALTRLRAELTLDNRAELDDLARAVRDGELDPFSAADRLLAAR